jgi:ribosomal-protein-alanine N-acetyltransferase
MAGAAITERNPLEDTLHPMTEHDLLEVVEIEETCGLSLWGWEGYRAELERPESIMLVARMPAETEDGKRLSGFIAARVTAGELHVNNVGVRPWARRRGLGSALLRATFERASQMGARAAVLEVRAGNTVAQSVYGRQGFVVAGRRRSYYREPVEDALVMTAPLETMA